ncbi:MAG: ligase-associated DNA damage response exonuclease [Saprospiraceae bacterium]|nr:ligase-associated DNA damage response exonuclease [Saprospiraceae bacterium]
MGLLSFSKKGIYCRQGDFYIDPWRKVDKAFITHAHSDHARPGSKKYVSTPDTKAILLHRLGHRFQYTGMEFGKTMTVNGVKVSFHPAGHIIGSAQVRVEYKGEVWVVSGDYKVQDDGISQPFELIRCNHFITESTFGLPVYSWRPQEEVVDEICNWWSQNQKINRPSILTAYSLGKAQRMIYALQSKKLGKIIIHSAIQNIQKIFQSLGHPFEDCELYDPGLGNRSGNELYIFPSLNISDKDSQLKNASTASASGWMALRRARRWRSIDRGFVLSDHADWKGLNDVIKGTGAENIYVTHGYQHIFSKWLNECGYNAVSVKTLYEGEQSESGEA